jgi:phosphotransferase system enzyme I (PtsI)
MNRTVGHLYDPLHPAVLRLIRHAIEVSHGRGKWTGMCGEMAGDPEAAAILVGLGLDEFSMSAISIPRFKKKMSSFTYDEACSIAAEAMKLSSAESIRQMLKSRDAGR